MTHITEILGKPFTTKTGFVVPEYAAPILEAYYKERPTTETFLQYGTPATSEVVTDTIIAIQATLTKLNGGNPTDDLSLLPETEYNILAERYTPQTLPQPPKTHLVGSAKYKIELLEATRMVEALWSYLALAFQLPISENRKQILQRIEEPYQLSAERKGLALWLTQLGSALAVTGVSIPSAIAGNPTITIIGGIVATITFFPAPLIWELYEEKIKNHRLKKFYQHQAKLDLETAHKEIESFLLQTRN